MSVGLVCWLVCVGVGRWVDLRLRVEGLGHDIVAGLEAAVAFVFEVGWF